MKPRWTLTVAMTLFLGTMMALCLTSANQAEEQQSTAAKPNAEMGPSGKIEYDSGYFATAISIPDDPFFSGITNITLEGPELTDRGGAATISIRNSKATFNDFGDAEVSEKRETRQFDVTLKPIPAQDFSNEGRHIFNLVFPEGQWENRIYFVWSPGTITASRLLIRRGDGKLPDLVIKTDRRRFENEIPLAYILPSANQISDKIRLASENLRDGFGLQSYHFQSKDVSQTEGEHQGFIRIGCKFKGPLKLTHDFNRTRFTPFGNPGMSTAVGYLPILFKVTETSTEDSTGLGRRLFQLEYQSRSGIGFQEGDDWKPPFDYSLVLAPKIDGPHRLIIRQQGQIRHVLPLHNAGWRRYQQMRIILAQTSKQEQEAIPEMRRLVGNRLSFVVQEDQVISISFRQLVKGGATLAHLEQFPRLKGLSFGVCRDLTPDELRPLKTLTQLESLSFSATPISDAVLAHLAPLEHLKFLQIKESRHFSNEGLEDIPHISDAGLESIAHLVNLNNLSLCGPGVTDAGLKYLHKLKVLKRLYFQATGVTLMGLYDLSKQLPDTEIQAARLTTQNGRDTCSFKIHGKRQMVWISGRADDSVLQQCAKCEGITTLSLSGVHAVTDEGLGDIAKMNDLEGLVIQHAKLITDEGLSQLKHQKKLKSLNLWYCKSITDKGLEHLHGLTELKSLQLGGTQVTQAGINRLQKALPACEIEK